MNENCHKFYIDSLEVFAVQKMRKFEINQKTTIKLTKIKLNIT